MPHWFLPALEWLAIVVGIAFGMALSFSIWVYAEFHSNASGYLYLAIRRLKFFLARVFIAELIIGLFLYLVFHLVAFKWLPASFPFRLLLSVITGMMAAAFPYLLEQQVRPKKTSVPQLQRTLTRPLTKILKRLNLITRSQLAKAIEGCRERDVFDCQDKGWDIGLTPTDIGRRLRIIYELTKGEIARQRRDPSFLRYDEGRTPWEKFYVLVKFLGRDELRRRIINPPPPPRKDWDGREYRQRPGPGSKDDRMAPDPDPSKMRCYDYPDRVQSIYKGE